MHWLERCYPDNLWSRWLRLVLPALIVLAAGGTLWAQEAPEPPRLDDDDVAELMQGEVIRDLERGEVFRGEVVGMIQAPVSELSAILLDYENLEEWSPAAYGVEILEQTGNEMLISGNTSLPWPIADRNWHLEVQHQNTQFDGQECFVNQWSYVHGSGNLDENYGYWLLCPYAADASYTVLRYVNHADPGIAIPNAVINWATRRALPDLIENLAERHDEVY